MNTLKWLSNSFLERQSVSSDVISLRLTSSVESFSGKTGVLVFI